VRAGDLDHQAPAAVTPVVLDVEVRPAVARVEQTDRIPFVAKNEARGGHRNPLRLDARDHGAHDRPKTREHPLVDALEEVLRRSACRRTRKVYWLMFPSPEVAPPRMREAEARREPPAWQGVSLCVNALSASDRPHGPRVLRRVALDTVAHLAPCPRLRDARPPEFCANRTS
jgi:hypothetical protein